MTEVPEGQPMTLTGRRFSGADREKRQKAFGLIGPENRQYEVIPAPGIVDGVNRIVANHERWGG